jgi:hypothetical protein
MLPHVILSGGVPDNSGLAVLLQAAGRDVSYIMFYLIMFCVFFVVRGFELRVLWLLGRHSASATPLTLTKYFRKGYI